MQYIHADGSPQTLPDFPQRAGEKTVYQLSVDGSAWEGNKNFTLGKCYPRPLADAVYYVTKNDAGALTVVACSRVSVLNKQLPGAADAPDQPIKICVSRGIIQPATRAVLEGTFQRADGSVQPLPDFPQRAGGKNVYRLSVDGSAWEGLQHFTLERCYPQRFGDAVYYVTKDDAEAPTVVACSRARVLNNKLPGAADAPDRPIKICVSGGTLLEASAVLEGALQRADGSVQATEPLSFPTMPGYPDFPQHAGEKTVYRLSANGSAWEGQNGFTLGKCYPQRLGDAVYYATKNDAGALTVVACSRVSVLNKQLPGAADAPDQPIKIRVSTGILRDARAVLEGAFQRTDGSLQTLPDFPQRAGEKTVYQLSVDGSAWEGKKSFTLGKCYPQRLGDVVYYATKNDAGALTVVACSYASVLNKQLPGAADAPHQPIKISVSTGALRDASAVLEGAFQRTDGSVQTLPDFPQRAGGKTVYRLSANGSEWEGLQHFTLGKCYPQRLGDVVYYATKNDAGALTVVACSYASVLNKQLPGAADAPHQPIKIHVNTGILRDASAVPETGYVAPFGSDIESSVIQGSPTVGFPQGTYPHVPQATIASASSAMRSSSDLHETPFSDAWTYSNGLFTHSAGRVHVHLENALITAGNDAASVNSWLAGTVGGAVRDEANQGFRMTDSQGVTLDGYGNSDASTERPLFVPDTVLTELVAQNHSEGHALSSGGMGFGVDTMSAFAPTASGSGSYVTSNSTHSGSSLLGKRRRDEDGSSLSFGEDAIGFSLRRQEERKVDRMLSLVAQTLKYGTLLPDDVKQTVAAYPEAVLKLCSRGGLDPMSTDYIKSLLPQAVLPQIPGSGAPPSSGYQANPLRPRTPAPPPNRMAPTVFPQHPQAKTPGYPMESAASYRRQPRVPLRQDSLGAPHPSRASVQGLLIPWADGVNHFFMEGEGSDWKPFVFLSEQEMPNNYNTVFIRAAQQGLLRQVNVSAGLPIQRVPGGRAVIQPKFLNEIAKREQEMAAPSQGASSSTPPPPTGPPSFRPSDTYHGARQATPSRPRTPWGQRSTPPPGPPSIPPASGWHVVQQTVVPPVPPVPSQYRGGPNTPQHSQSNPAAGPNAEIRRPGATPGLPPASHASQGLPPRGTYRQSASFPNPQGGTQSGTLALGAHPSSVLQPYARWFPPTTRDNSGDPPVKTPEFPRR